MMQQAFVSEAFHPDDTIREIWADLMGRASAKARGMGGRFAEPGIWNVSPPLDDDDFCYHVRLMFSVSMPEMEFQHALVSAQFLLYGDASMDPPQPDMRAAALEIEQKQGTDHLVLGEE